MRKRLENGENAIRKAQCWKAIGMDGLAFRLDRAIEHLLLDEFQDTALVQWLVLQPVTTIVSTPAAVKDS